MRFGCTNFSNENEYFVLADNPLASLVATVLGLRSLPLCRIDSSIHNGS